MGRLTTHVLDTANGCPGSGIELTLYRVDGNQRIELTSAKTNTDGRTNTPLLEGDGVLKGSYELVFEVAAYHRNRGLVIADPPFLDVIPIRFSISDADAHYHVPLLVSPWSFSTYRGS